MADITVNEWMPLIYVIVGAVIGGIFGLFTQKMMQKHDLRKFQLECENQRKMLLFEKTKLEKIEAYKHLLGSYKRLKMQIALIIRLNYFISLIEKEFKGKEKLPKKGIKKFFSKIPSTFEVKTIKYLSEYESKSDILKPLIELYEQQTLNFYNYKIEVLSQSYQFSLFINTKLNEILEKLDEYLDQDNLTEMNDEQLEDWGNDTEELLLQLKNNMMKEIQELKYK